MRNKTLVKRLQSKLQDITKYFGTEGYEYNKFVALLEQSFKRVPMTDKQGNTHFTDLSFPWDKNTSTAVVSLSGIDTKKDVYGNDIDESAYNIALSNALRRIDKMGTIFQLGKQYKKASNGKLVHFRSLQEIEQYADEIKEQSARRFRYETMNDNLIYISGKHETLGLFSEIEDKEMQEKIREKLRSRKGLSANSVKSMTLYREAVNMILDQLILENSKKQEYEKSQKKDEKEPYSARNAVRQLTNTKRRGKK